MNRPTALLWATTCALWAGTVCGCDEPRKAGDTCKLSEGGKLVACEGRDAALVCDAGGSNRLSRVPCRGPEGCTSRENRVWCDSSLGKIGERCHLEESDDAKVCSFDGSSLLICSDSKWQLDALCRGKNKCKKGDCDRTVARAGDPCEERRDRLGACSEDGKLRLYCEEGEDQAFTFKAGAICSGPKGCWRGRLGGDGPPMAVCDTSAQKAGAPCGKRQQSSTSCSADKRAVLKCEDRKWNVSHSCAEGESCKEREGEIGHGARCET